MQKWTKRITGGLLILALLTMYGVTAKASMADEAEYYELETEYRGYANWSSRYFVFQIPEKAYVSLRSEGSGVGDYLEYTIYSSEGNEVLESKDVFTSHNTYCKTAGRILPAGTYYLEVYSAGDFSFRIQAEKFIKLPKGEIVALNSQGKGQMTVQCGYAADALGYRIQYSTDYRFKKKVKTIYSPTTTKTIKKLKKGKRYYVKVCPFTTYDDGTNVYGNNSYVKTVVVRR